MAHLQQLYPVLWFFFAVVMLTQVLPFAMIAFRLLRFELGDITFSKLDDAAPMTALQQAAIAEVLALGFEKAMVYAIHEGPEACTAVLFRHPTLPAVANIYLRPGSFLSYPVWFWSFGTDGAILMTANRQPISMGMPGVTADDAYAASLPQHWQAHQARMAKAQLETLSADAAYARITETTSGYARYNLDRGHFSGADGHYFMTLKAALKLTSTYMKSRRKMRTPYATIATSDEFRSEFYAETYRVYTDATKRLRARRGVSMGLLLISGVVSTVLFGWWLGWYAAAAVVLVLLVHECGHAAAMRLFGYRDMNMFFIPFMGAVVTGTARDVPVWKQVIVLLAGPVPGLLFGIWAVLHIHDFPAGSFMHLLALNAALINLFNLLPLAFLDGGKIVEIALLSRWPYALVAFDALSALALGTLMVTIEAYNMLFIVFIMALTILPLWRSAKLRGAVQREGTSGLPALFALAEKIIAKKSFNRQYYLVRTISEKPHVLPARRWEIALSLLLFFAIWGAAGYTWEHWNKDRAQEAKFDAAVQKYYSDASKEGADKTLKAAAAQLDPNDPRQIDAIAIPAFRLEDKLRIDALENLIAMKRDGRTYSRGGLVSTYLGYAGWSAEKQLPKRIEKLEQALARMDALAPELYADTVKARIHLAELRDQNKETAKASADLEHLLVTTATADNCHCAERDAAAAQAWYYIDKGQADKAVTFLNAPPYAEMTGKTNDVSLAYAWALLENGKIDAGLKQMVIAAPYYNDDDPYEASNLDLIYAYWRAGNIDKAASLIPEKFRHFYCEPEELADALYDNNWHTRVVAATKEALKAVCAAPKPASPTP